MPSLVQMILFSNKNILDHFIIILLAIFTLHIAAQDIFEEIKSEIAPAEVTKKQRTYSRYEKSIQAL